MSAQGGGPSGDRGGSPTLGGQSTPVRGEGGLTGAWGGSGALGASLQASTNRNDLGGAAGSGSTLWGGAGDSGDAGGGALSGTRTRTFSGGASWGGISGTIGAGGTRLRSGYAGAGAGGFVSAGGTDSPQAAAGRSTGGGLSVDGGGASGVGPGTWTGGSAGHVPEICNNHFDDNGDGDIDCADQDCDSWFCVPSVPDGWSRPISLARGAAVSELPSCSESGGYDTPKTSAWCSKSQLSTQTATCPACPNCGRVTSLIETVDVTLRGSCFSSTGSCVTSPCDASRFSLKPGCNEVSLDLTKFIPGTTFSQLGMVPDNTYVHGGTCAVAATSSTPSQVPEAPCKERTIACAGSLSTGSCNAIDGECVPRPTGSFRQLCIYQEGEAASCPPGWDAQPPEVVYRTINDKRGCSDCVCKGPAPGSIRVTAANVWDHGMDPSCQVSGTVPNSGLGGCLTLSPAVSSTGSTASRYLYVEFFNPTVLPSCQSSGGVAAGQVEALNPSTLCCINPTP